MCIIRHLNGVLTAAVVTMILMTTPPSPPHAAVRLLLLLLLPFLWLVTMTSAVIYLEDFDGALQYDEGLPTVITPGQYLTHSPIPLATIIPAAPNNDINKSGAPSAVPTTTVNEQINNASFTTTNTPSPSAHTTIDSITISPTNEINTMHDDTNNVPSTTTNSTTTTTTIITTAIMQDHNDVTNSSLFDRRKMTIIEKEIDIDVRHSSLNAQVQGSSHPTSSVTSFTSSLLSSLSSSSISSSSSSSSWSSDGDYFDDLSIINDSRNYVYYDSKQATFGVDLGPRGNAKLANIMLPPRWYDYFSEQNEEMTKYDGSMDGSDNVTNTTSTSILGTNESGIPSNFSMANSTDFWWNFVGGGNATATTENIFDVNTTFVGNDSRRLNNSTGFQNITDIAGNGTINENSHDIADYFCLEDFVNWRMEYQQNFTSASSFETSSSPSTSNSTTFNLTTNISTTALQPNPSDLVVSTRPLTILIRRGRCTFESKAQMAMVLNELFLNSGKNNRIDHIIVYNNGTDDDNNTDTDEELINMGHESKRQENDITVGLLYISSSSGEDLLRRIKKRQISTSVSPYVDVSGFFYELSNEHDTQKSDRRLTESESNKPDWENDTIGQYLGVEGYHDKKISHGWWFPATLTRFCFSCGPEMQYGLIWDDDDDDVAEAPRLNDDYQATPQPYGGGYPSDPLDRLTMDVYLEDWYKFIRDFLVATLVLLLVGPIFVVAVRWYIVGGTFRIATDENGVRRFRIVSPNLEAFVNGVPGTVETNGTKLDRAQVFSLPEIEYADAVDEESNNNDHPSSSNECDFPVPGTMRNEVDYPNSTETAVNRVTPSRESPRSGRFISSSCCTICLEEFTLGERIRMLPRCSHGKFIARFV